MIRRNPFYPAFLSALLILLFPVSGRTQVQGDFRGGAVVIGTSTTTCAAGTAGALRFNDPDNTLEVCNGSTWTRIDARPCDSIPTTFSFTALTRQTTSTLVTSNIAPVTGMDAACDVTVGVNGSSGSPEFRICSTSNCSAVTQDWTGTDTTLAMQGAYLQLRATTSGSAGTTFTITADVGTRSSEWTITTEPAACSSLPVGSVCSDGTVYAGTTPDGDVPMYVTRCDAGQTWNGSSCTGSRSYITFNDGSSSGNVDTSLDNCASMPACNPSGETETTTLAAEDSNTAVGTQSHLSAVYCNDLNLHGQTDWYQPSMRELYVMFENSTAIGNFNTDPYGSSSEGDTDRNWKVGFNNGSHILYDKAYGGNPLRCARK